jgi:hypothetical protein
LNGSRGEIDAGQKGVTDRIQPIEGGLADSQDLAIWRCA